MKNFQSGVDVSAMLDMHPELIQHFYDSYGQGQYAPIAIELMNMAKSNPQDKELVGIKNVMQAQKMLPPDDKMIAVENMKKMGVKHNHAVDAVNKIEPMRGRQLALFKSSIKSKVPMEKHHTYKQLLDMVEALNG